MVGTFVRTLTYAVQAISSRLHGLTYGKKNGFAVGRSPTYAHTSAATGCAPSTEHSSLSKSTSHIL